MSIPGKHTENGVYEFEYMRKVDTTPKWEKFKRGIWNPQTNAFLGRTAKSWAGIISFYLVFYTVLAALFAICMYGLMSSLNDHAPTWQLHQSLIGVNPGLGFRPISRNTEEGSLIWFKSNDSDSVLKWKNEIDEFLDVYLHREKLPIGTNQTVCQFGQKLAPGQVCEVNVDQWDQCNGLKDYGYSKNAPCIFLKLNKIYGWQPEFYNDPENLPSDMPTELKEHITNLPKEERNQIWISCDGEQAVDKELIGPINYIPTRGFPEYYYPYTNSKGYLNPLLAVQLSRPKVNIIINIECRAWAKNIEYRGGNQYRQGSVHFELLID